MTALGCLGKHHYSTKAKALRGVNAILREDRDGKKDPRGTLGVYRCQCGQWCIRRGYEGAPAHRRREDLSPADFGRGAELFAQAEEIAKARFPDGANASQLASILRELLSAPEKVAG